MTQNFIRNFLPVNILRADILSFIFLPHLALHPTGNGTNNQRRQQFAQVEPELKKKQKNYFRRLHLKASMIYFLRSSLFLGEGGTSLVFILLRFIFNFEVVLIFWVVFIIGSYCLHFWDCINFSGYFHF